MMSFIMSLDIINSKTFARSQLGAAVVSTWIQKCLNYMCLCGTKGSSLDEIQNLLQWSFWNVPLLLPLSVLYMKSRLKHWILMLSPSTTVTSLIAFLRGWNRNGLFSRMSEDVISMRKGYSLSGKQWNQKSQNFKSQILKHTIVQ